MATQTTTSISEYVDRKARLLLQDRDQWQWARNKATGVSFVTVPSSCTDRRCPGGPKAHEHIHNVHPLGASCDCPAVQTWNAAICSHARAVQLANEEDHRAEVAPVMASNLASIHAYVMAASMGASEDDCRAAGHAARETVEQRRRAAGRAILEGMDS